MRAATLLIGALVLAAELAAAAEIRTRRDAAFVAFPGESGAADEGATREVTAQGEEERADELARGERSPDDEDYEDDSPEGRHFKLKRKHKFKPHKHGHGGGLLDGLLGGYGGGHGHGHGHGGHGGHGCRKLHGCGGGGGYGGWQPPFGGYGGGPIAAAFAGPSQGYGGWNPGYGGGYGPRPHSQSQVATWNLGPFQGSFGLAQAG